MKKNLKRIVFGSIFSLIIVWLIILLTNGVIIAKSEYSAQNIIFYIILFVIFAYYMIFYIIKPTYIKRFKVINTCLGLFVISFSHIYLANSGIDHIYYGDIITLIGVFLTIIGPTKALVSKSFEKSRTDVEIIDV